MKKLVWIDDMRDPFTWTWVKDYSPIGTDDVFVIWVKNFDEFKNYIDKDGLPDAICFDHDLGDMLDHPELEKTGYDCAQYIIEYCIERNIDIPLYNVQSSNPVGKKNIESLMDNYHKFYLGNKGIQ